LETLILARERNMTV